MAGMLPGVEAARRRRVHHQSSSCSLSPGKSSSPTSRRASFSLFSSFSSASSLAQPRNRTYQDDEKLGHLARQARERLDEKLRAQTTSLIIRSNNDLSEQRTNERSRLNYKGIRTEVFGSKKNGGAKRLMGWAKLGWKSGEQEECAVCLDEFRVGENLVNLQCAHRFHSRCLVPWLHSNAHCPCCRTSIFS